MNRAAMHTQACGTLRIKNPGALGIAFFAAVLMLCAFSRNGVWADEGVLWENVLSGSGAKWRPFYRIGLNDYMNGRYADAVGRFAKALERKPEAGELHNNMGLAYQRLGMFEKAVEQYRMAIGKGAGGSSAFTNMGTVFLEKGDYKTALKWFLDALEINPYDSAAITNAGFAYFDTADYRRSVEMHKRALSVNPYSINAHYGLGLAYEGSGDYGKALKHWRLYAEVSGPGAWRDKARRRIDRLSQRGGFSDVVEENIQK